MDDARRDFLKKAGLAAISIGALPLVGAGVRAMTEAGASTGIQYGMVIDIAKCGNQALVAAAVKACHSLHNVPAIPKARQEEEIKWIWTEHFENVFPNMTTARVSAEVKERPVIVLCNHCNRPSCVRVCPTKATWKRPSDGIVMMDMHRCIGCRFCMAACPYGSRSFNFSDPRKYLETNKGMATNYPTRTKGVVEKCQFCSERLREGLQPACVEAANAIEPGAMIFGDVNDPNSEISSFLKQNYTVVRRLEMGTGPNVYYKM